MLTKEQFDQMDFETYGSEQRREGEINTLIKLVKNKRISAEAAAEECDMTVEQFTEMHLKPSLKE